MNSVYQYDKRKDFVINITQLSLYYIHYQSHKRKRISIEEILNRQTPIYRLTSFWDGIHHPAKPDFPSEQSSQWQQITNSLSRLYKKYDEDALSFEKAGFELLWPFLEDRIEKDIVNWPWIPCGYVPYKLPSEQVFGIFAYEISETSSPRQGMISFHIANSCMPESPFKDMNARAEELLKMIRDIKVKISSALAIGCSSWLNSFPPFLQLFPEFYVNRDSVPSEVSYGFSWWGQFMSRDGSFHRKNGDFIRQTGEFPFVCLAGKCGIDELEEHLLTNFLIMAKKEK